jgi:hypothetical protein
VNGFVVEAALAALLLAPKSPVVAPPARTPSSYRIVDSVTFAERASWLQHHASIGGGIAHHERAGVGALVLPVAGARLLPGGVLQARLATRGGDELLLVTLATSPRDYGKCQAYRVLIDGLEAMHASEPDPGGGITRSFYVGVPRGKPRRLLVRIEADRDSPTPIIVASLRVVAGAAAPALSSDPRSRIEIALLSPKGLGYDIDRAEMERIRDLVPRNDILVPQAAVLYNFAKRDAAANASEISRLAGFAVDSGVPLRIAFQFHWGGIPSGVPDGAGGTFTDLPYQMITYDPANTVMTPGLAALMGNRFDPRFGLSIPNQWDLPWLTFNHPRLNQLYRARIHQALAAWLEARDRLAASDRANLLPGALSTGEETIYWAKGVGDAAYTAANGGHPRTDLSADFNPYTVADAMADGIMLDPRNGLDGKERWWLHQNLGRRQQRIVDWMLGAVPAEPIRITPDGPRFADDLVRRNIYTEPYGMPFFPMKDISDCHPQLEVGYVRDGRSGGEYFSGATMLPWLLKERERGRIALPNLECTGADDAQLVACLRAAYACGARFITLYNWPWRTNITALLAEFARSIAPVPWLTYPPARRAVTPVPLASTPDPRKSSAGAVAPTAQMPRPLGRSWATGPGAFGINCVELYATEPIREASVRVEVRAEDGSRALSVTAPVSATQAGEMMRIHLPVPFPTQPGHRYRITAIAAGERSLPLATGEDGDLAVRLAIDIATERRRSMIVGDMQDARDITDSLLRAHATGSGNRYAAAALSEARARLADGDPVAAYAAAVRAEQLTLPASFDLPAPGGRLAPYNIEVACPTAPIRATIVAVGKTAATIRMRSGSAQTVTVRWEASEITARLAPNVAAEIVLAKRDGTPPKTRRRGNRNIDSGKMPSPSSRT